MVVRDTKDHLEELIAIRTEVALSRQLSDECTKAGRSRDERPEQRFRTRGAACGIGSEEDHESEKDNQQMKIGNQSTKW